MATAATLKTFCSPSLKIGRKLFTWEQRSSELGNFDARVQKLISARQSFSLAAASALSSTTALRVRLVLGMYWWSCSEGFFISFAFVCFVPESTFLQNTSTHQWSFGKYDLNICQITTISVSGCALCFRCAVAGVV